MALAFPAFTITCTPAEYTLLNEGIAAPISPTAGAQPAANGTFGGILPPNAVTAQANAGNTLVTITVGNGFRNDFIIRQLAQRVRRAYQNTSVTFTP
jgi:hypothetical protein